MSTDDYNPNSVDAKLATIIANQERVLAVLEKHDKEIDGIKTKIAWVSGSIAAGITGIKIMWDLARESMSKGN